jgi:group I intron endonuclease
VGHAQLDIVSCVYLITNQKTSKRYVGCTTSTLKRRWQQHVATARNGSPYLLHKSLRKHGKEVFRIEILEVIPGTHEDLLRAEVAWIRRLDCVAPKGYNLTRGGQGLDFTVPEVKAAQKEGSRKRSATSAWRSAQSIAKLKLHNDPEYKKRHVEGVRRKASDPTWVKAVTEANRSKPKDPDWIAAHAKGVQERSRNLIWRNNLVEGARKRSANPNWQRASADALSRGRSITAAKALERDALCSPEERERRIKRREAVRRSAAKRKRERLARVL